jgi:serine/threonine protein phosphatase PrpC
MEVGETHEQIHNQPTDARTEIGGWRVVAASVRGTSHARTGRPCQDAHHWDIWPEGILVAAVADGAGSATRGELGAEVAVRVAVEAIYPGPTIPPLPEDDEGWRLLLTNTLKAARGAVEAEAAAREVTARDLATTLIVVVATHELVVAAQIGDGAAVVSDGEANLIALTTPQSGEYINETTFLISPDALEKAQVTVWRGAPKHLAVFSDGLQMLALKMPDGTPHAPFFSPLFRFVANVTNEVQAQEQLAAFLCSPRITERADDDLTLLLATLVG